ncbi:hypothetical protein [Pasteurella sp. PK-2025]|uniref:hypothetical protein n=1 Tax=Pasteurella sp. PK-2025 TaxID=3413133 RepID=UPI003C77875A
MAHNIGQELLNVPFGDMVVQLASAIAEGQYKMDLVSVEIAKKMGQEEVALPSLKPNGGPVQVTLLGAGFQPTFYQFTDSIIEVKIAITMVSSKEASIAAKAKLGWACFSASVNASYSSKYSYSVEGSSLLRTKITPLPPNEFLRSYLERYAEGKQQKLKDEVKEEKEPKS